MYKILLVCTGNICRSPTAEGVLRNRLKKHGLEQRVVVDSAGTHSYHVNEPPDSRSVSAARQRGVLIGDLRARKVSRDDFVEFDLILGLDGGHVEFLKRLSPSPAKAHVDLYLSYASGIHEDVPDPYYGSSKGFEHVLDLTEAASEDLAQRLKNELKVN